MLQEEEINFNYEIEFRFLFLCAHEKCVYGERKKNLT